MRKITEFILVCLLLLSSGLAAAQQQTEITYGSTLEDTISADSPQAIYTFEGTEYDWLIISVNSLTPDFQPRVTLLDDQQQILTTADHDPFIPYSADVRLSYRLKRTGTYSLVVEGDEGTVGDFSLRLESTETTLSLPLEAESTTRVDLRPIIPPRVYSFVTELRTATTLTFTSEPPSFPYTVEVRDDRGNLIALMDSGRDSAQITLPPATSLYEIILSSRETGTAIVTLSSEPREPRSTDALLLNPCVVRSAGGNVNIRQGPGTEYPTVGSLIRGNTLAVTGTNADGSWYAVDVFGERAWIAASVVSLARDCESLPAVE